MGKVILLKINGVEQRADVEPRTTLLDLVREQFGLTGAKLGCDIQVCGACTLLVNGKPVSACSFLAVDADGCDVTTIEGLRAGETSVAAQTPDLVAACGRLEHEIGEWLGALAQTEDTSR